MKEIYKIKKLVYNIKELKNLNKNKMSETIKTIKAITIFLVVIMGIVFFSTTQEYIESKGQINVKAASETIETPEVKAKRLELEAQKAKLDLELSKLETDPKAQVPVK